MQFYSQKTGHTSNTEMWTSIVKQLAENGFTLISTNGDSGETVIDDKTPIESCVLEATSTVDPLSATQPWRIKIECTDIVTRIWAATPKQIADEGLVTKVTSDFDSGALCIASGSPQNLPNSREVTNAFYSREEFGLKDADEGAFPFSYHLSITDHGIACMIWVEGKDNTGNAFSWFVIQRPVKKDGSVVVSGKAPLFCVYSIGGGGGTDLDTTVPGGILKFVVREDDVHMPTPPISAVINTADSEALINPIQQVAITEEEEFVASFPNNLTTQRYKYPYELDLVCTTSADVISQFNETDITQYEEATKRKFKAMNANHASNKGMRVLFLIEDNKALVV